MKFVIKAEGDRGGKVVGHTRSGKPIYESKNHEGYSHQDHFDAWAAHSHLAESSKDLGKFNFHSSLADHHYDKIKDKDLKDFGLPLSEFNKIGKEAVGKSFTFYVKEK